MQRKQAAQLGLRRRQPLAPPLRLEIGGCGIGHYILTLGPGRPQVTGVSLKSGSEPNDRLFA